jgi:hypothetical protein
MDSVMIPHLNYNILKVLALLINPIQFCLATPRMLLMAKIQEIKLTIAKLTKGKQFQKKSIVSKLKN